MSEESILLKVFSSANSTIATHCKQFLDSVPEDPAQYQHYLKTFIFIGSPVNNFLKNAALHGYQQFYNSYQDFISFFPKITKNLTESPKKLNGLQYFTEYMKIDWSSDAVKHSIWFFIQKCITNFLLEMISLSQTISSNQIESIVLDFVKNVNSLDSTSPAYNKSVEQISILESIESWSYVMYALSKMDAQKIWDTFTSCYSKMPNTDLFKQACLLSAFSSIVFENDLAEKTVKFILTLDGNFMKYSGIINNLFCVNCCSFMHNAIYQYNECTKAGIDSPMNRQILSSATGQLDFNPAAFNLIAHLSNSIQTPNFSSVKNYIDYYSQVKPEMRPHYLRSIVYKFWGEEYVSQVKKSLDHENYGFSIKNSAEALDYIIKFMCQNDTTLQDYGNELAEVVEHMIIANLSHFVKTILPIMDYNQQTRTNICRSLYRGLNLFFSNSTVYRQLNRNQECLSDYPLLESKTARLVLCYLQSSQSERIICDVCFDTDSFTQCLSTSSSQERENVLISQIKNLQVTSKPIFTLEKNFKELGEYLSQLIINADIETGKAFFSEPLDKQPERKPSSINVDLQNVISITPYIPLDDDILNRICYSVLAPSAENGAHSMRILQSLVHLNHNYVDIIVQYLCDYFLSNSIDFISITLVINTICLVLESANYEGIVLSNLSMSRICFVAVLGFCIPYPSIHQKIFDFCRMLSFFKTSTFYLQAFFEKHEEELSLDAMRRASQAIMAVSDNEAKLFAFISFHDAALTSMPTFYLFYLSAFGQFIKKYNEGFEYSILHATKVLSRCLFSMPAENLCSKFGLNCLTLLLSITDEMSDFNLGQLRRVCSKVIANFAKMDNPTNPIKLIAIFSAVTKSLYYGIVPLFARSSLSVARAFSFTTQEQIRNKNFSDIIFISQNGQKSVNPILFSAFHSALILCYSKYIKEELMFHPGTTEVKNFSQFHLFLDNFGNSLKAVFEEIAALNKSKSATLFMCENAQIHNEINHPFNTEKWFIFFCNLVSCKETIFCEDIMAAFNKWLEISHIPDAHFHTFMLKLPKIGKLFPDISTTIFKQNTGNLLPFYIVHSRNNFHMFMAIANQITIQDILSERNVSESISFRYGDTELLFYQNCGSLIALALFNIISRQTAKRTAAYNFLMSLIIIIGLFRNDTNSTSEIFNFLESKKSDLMNSFTVFLQRDFETLNSLLAKHFKFCGEQFANECFSIVKMIKVKEPEGTRLAMRKNTSISKSSIAIMPMPDGKGDNRPGSPPNNRYSVRFAKDAILGVNYSIANQGNQPEKIDQTTVEKPQILTSLIAPWVNPIAFDLHQIGICRDCEEEYRVFGIYSFVNGLLTLCNAQGMTQPLADIVDILIENNPELFTHCLYDLQTHSESHAKSATLFFIYLYNRIPDAFVKYIREYLRVPSWYFYEIQVSKVDQTFDIGKFLDTLGPDKHNEDDLEDDDEKTFEIDYGQVIMFTLNLIEECRKENESRLAEIRSFVLIFCLIHNAAYSDIANILIENITHLKPNNPNSGAAQMSFVRQTVESWKLPDVVPFIEGSERFLLEWGLACGDLTAASKALQIFELKEYTLPDSAVQTMLNAMQAVSAALRERTDPAKKGQFGQWLMRVVGDNTRTNYEAVVSWLCACLKLLKRYISSTDKTSADSFWTAASFLQCHSAEYNSLFISALQIVDMFLSRSQLIILLKEADICKISHGLIPLLFEVKLQEKEALNSIFTIISNTLINDLIYLLLHQNSAAFIAVFALIPWIYTKFNTIEKSHEFALMLTKYIPNSAKMAKDIEELGFFESATHKSISRISNSLYDKVNTDELKMVLHFFIQIVKNGTISQKECIFIICNSILDKLISCKEISEEISLITYYAVTDSSTQNSTNVLDFLRNLCLRDVRVTNPPTLTAGRTFTIFPLMEISNDLLTEWEPRTEDVFAEYPDFPPLFITDPGFNGSVYLKGIKKVIDKIVTVPFNEWYELLFKAQLQSVTGTSEKINGKLATIEVQAREFLNSVSDNLKRPLAGRKMRRPTSEDRKRARYEELSKEDANDNFFINPNTFFISADESDALIPDDIKLEM